MANMLKSQGCNPSYISISKNMQNKEAKLGEMHLSHPQSKEQP